jgi:hypothetical protein
MTKFIICSYCQLFDYERDPVTEDETSEACDTYGREQQFTKGFGLKPWYNEID